MDKLGEGAHASVYKCYLVRDREIVDEYYSKLKELGLEPVQEIDSALDIFARADDHFSLDRIIEEDELSTATPIHRKRGISYNQDEEKFTL